MIENSNKNTPIYSELLPIADVDNIRAVLEWQFELPELHICKISAGWVPCFESTAYYKSWKEFKTFYKKYKKYFDLVDEYNEKLTLSKLEKKLKEHKKTALASNDRRNLDLHYIQDEDGYDWINANFT